MDQTTVSICNCKNICLHHSSLQCWNYFHIFDLIWSFSNLGNWGCDSIEESRHRWPPSRNYLHFNRRAHEDKNHLKGMPLWWQQFPFLGHQAVKQSRVGVAETGEAVLEWPRWEGFMCPLSEELARACSAYSCQLISDWVPNTPTFTGQPMETDP